MVNSADLRASRELLRTIAEASYNDAIRPVALALWEKHLAPENPQWAYLGAKAFTANGPDGAAHVMAITDSRLPGLGIVGYFACTTVVAGAEVLASATAWLRREQGLADVYGPINGTLPSDYRLNLADDYRIPGEPVNPSWYMEAFRAAGFSVYNRYISGTSRHYRWFTKLFIRRPSKKAAAAFRVRPFGEKGQQRDFAAYHALRNAIFPFQSIYCPAISLDERSYNQGGKDPIFDPKYTYFLENADGVEVGLVMAYPYEGNLIVKTLGLLPEYRGRYLSGLLLHRVHDQAHADGLKSAVYAMIREGNSVSKMKRPGVRIYRRYVTMHKHTS